MDYDFPISWSYALLFGDRPTRRWAERAARWRIRRMTRKSRQRTHDPAFKQYLISSTDEDLQREFERIKKELEKRQGRGTP